MPVLFDKAAFGGTTGGLSATINTDIGNLVQRLVIAMFRVFRSTDVVTTVTFAGIPMDLHVKTERSGVWWLYTYYLIDPPIGNGDCVINLSTLDQIDASVLSFSNVNPIDSLGTPVVVDGTAITASISVPDVREIDMVVDQIAGGSSTPAWTPGDGQDLRTDHSTFRPQATSTKVDEGTVNMEWNLGTGGPYTQQGMLIRGIFRESKSSAVSFFNGTTDGVVPPVWS